MGFVNPFSGEEYESLEDFKEKSSRVQEEYKRQLEAKALSDRQAPISKRIQNAMNKFNGDGLGSFESFLECKEEFDSIAETIRLLPYSCEEYKSYWIPQCEGISKSCEEMAKERYPKAYADMKEKEK